MHAALLMQLSTDTRGKMARNPPAIPNNSLHADGAEKLTADGEPASGEAAST
jgi:hypothetical protein